MNWKIICISSIGTLLLLFGSWYGIQHFSLDKPIQEWFEENEQISLENLDISQADIKVEVTFKDEHFGPYYIELIKYLDEIGKGKKIIVDIDPKWSENNEWWLHYSPIFIELIKNEKYSQIASHLDQLQQENIIINGNITMNNQFIFLYVEPVNEDKVFIVYILQDGEKGGNTA